MEFGNRVVAKYLYFTWPTEEGGVAMTHSRERLLNVVEEANLQFRVPSLRMILIFG